jgi:hypothetical protein
MTKIYNILNRMTEYFEQKGVPVKVQRINKGYSIIHESGNPIAQFRPEPGSSDLIEVLWWSSHDKWDHIGDFGGLTMTLEEALEYVLSDPMDIFWMGLNRDAKSTSMRNSGKLGLIASLGKLFGGFKA